LVDRNSDRRERQRDNGRLENLYFDRRQPYGRHPRDGEVDLLIRVVESSGRIRNLRRLIYVGRDVERPWRLGGNSRIEGVHIVDVFLTIRVVEYVLLSRGRR
jgi:hypothetical protein